MRRVIPVPRVLPFVLLAVFLCACTAVQKKSEDTGFQSPSVSLKDVKIPRNWGWWFFSDQVTPTHGKPGNYGAPLALAFIFEIHNPNSFAVELVHLTFRVVMDDFELDTVIVPEAMWIPASKTNQLRATSVIDVRLAQLSLLAGGTSRLKDEGVTIWEALERYWTGIVDFSTPVQVEDGSAVFKAEGVERSVSFNAHFP